jgi:hypothetical protein
MNPTAFLDSHSKSFDSVIFIDQAPFLSFFVLT